MSVNVFPPVSGAAPAYLIDATQSGSVAVDIPSGIYDYTIATSNDLSQGITLGSRNVRFPRSGTIYLSGNVSTASSLNGIPNTWTSRTSGTSSSITCLTYGRGNYVAGIGSNNLLRTSTDAITWVSRTSNFSSAAIRGAAASPDILVIVGDTGQISSSTDAITWTARSSGVPDTLNGAFYLNDRFVAPYNSGVVVSTNGTTWTAHAHGSGPVGAKAAAYDGSRYYVAGGNTIRVTTNFSSWGPIGAVPSTVSDIFGITHANGILVAVGQGGIATSDNAGVTWTSRASGSTTRFDGVTFANDFFIAYNASGISVSTDAITWRFTSNSGASEAFTFGNNLFVAGGFGGNIRTAPGDFPQTQLILTGYKPKTYTI